MKIRRTVSCVLHREVCEECVLHRPGSARGFKGRQRQVLQYVNNRTSMAAKKKQSRLTSTPHRMLSNPKSGGGGAAKSSSARKKGRGGSQITPTQKHHRSLWRLRTMSSGSGSFLPVPPVSRQCRFYTRLVTSILPSPPISLCGVAGLRWGADVTRLSVCL